MIPTPSFGKNIFAYQLVSAKTLSPTNTSSGKSVHYEMLILLLDHKQSEVGRGWGSYAVVLVILLLVHVPLKLPNLSA